jgi:hypothetical protein
MLSSQREALSFPLLLLLLLLPLLQRFTHAQPAPPPQDLTPTTEPGFESLRKFLPPVHTPGEEEDEAAWGEWPPYRSSPSISFKTTQGGSWFFRPSNGTESVLFVLVERSLKYLPTFGWEEMQTGLSPWSSRPDLHIVFVPMTDAMDAHKVAQEAHSVLKDSNAEYWLPRMHFSLDTVEELRKSSSWFASYVDAWSTPAPSVAVLSL